MPHIVVTFFHATCLLRDTTKGVDRRAVFGRSRGLETSSRRLDAIDAMASGAMASADRVEYTFA